MTDQLTQWARSLFNDISNAGYPKAEDRVAPEPVPVSNPAPATNASPAPDFRYRPVVTGGKSIPHGGYVK